MTFKISFSFILSALIAITLLVQDSLASSHAYCDCNLNSSSPCTCYEPGSSSITTDNPQYTGTSGDYKVEPLTTKTVYVACNDTQAYAMNVQLSDTTHFSCTKSADGQRTKVSCENENILSSYHFHLDSYTCSKYVVTGYWVERLVIVADTDYEIQYGATKSDTQTETDTWNDSVTTSVSSGFQAEGASVTATTSKTVGQTVSQTDSVYWSVSETTTYTTHYDSSYDGDIVWQWQYTIVDPWGNQVIAMTDYLAVTSNVTVTPKCIGGHLMDNGAYQACQEGYYLPGEEENSSSSNRRYLRSKQA